ncbi:MAG: peptide chain release factor N(5)-glutamine methyltransferase [Clostridia bacterium]
MAKTVNDLYMHYSKILDSQLEAREIVAFALDLDRQKTLDWGHLFIGDESEKKVETIIQRRLSGEPLAYILGEWEFYSLPFKVTPAVLIPRADTETLIDRALVYLYQKPKPRVLDLCAGSGCVGITIAYYTKEARVTACDISNEALDVAKFNAKLNQVNQRYMSVTCDVLKPDKTLGMFDLIVSNPPYIPAKDIKTLDTDVKDFEPLIALDGGDDGLIFYRAICENFLKMLKPKGQIMFEYGIGQENDIARILRSYGLCEIKITKDLCGINRVIQATKPEILI